jgi:hypothetical protein
MLKAKRNLVWVNDIELPEPSSFEANTATIIDSARNLNGVVVGTILRSDVAKVTLSWNFLTPTQWGTILSATSSFYCDVFYYSQTAAGWETRHMYVSDRNATMFRRNPDITSDSPDLDFPVVGWKGAKLSLVEV